MITKFLTTTLLILGSGQVLAQECSAVINSTDQMTFSTKALEVDKSCARFTVELQHGGSLPKAVMGHNWVLTETQNAQAVATDGVSAGIDKSFVKDNDPRVIAHTKVIGAGEKDAVTFDVKGLDPTKEYTFFCSVPGHISMMKGTLSLK